MIPRGLFQSITFCDSSHLCAFLRDLLTHPHALQACLPDMSVLKHNPITLPWSTEKIQGHKEQAKQPVLMGEHQLDPLFLLKEHTQLRQRRGTTLRGNERRATMGTVWYRQ